MNECADIKFNKKSLEKLYKNFNKYEYIKPDPLQFVYEYASTAD